MFGHPVLFYEFDHVNSLVEVDWGEVVLEVLFRWGK